MAPVTPLIRPILPDMRLVEEHLRESFRTRRLSNFGPAARRLSAAFEEQFLPGRVVLTSSGHAALMAAIGIYPSARRWAVPAFTFESTRLAVVEQGREAVYVDVDESGIISLESLRRVEWDGVVVVCPLSTVPDVAPVLDLAAGRPVVLDGAAAFGSALPRGCAVCVSFHATKVLPIGEGGAVCGLDEAGARAVERYVNFGLVGDDPSGSGLNAKLSEYAAAVGLALLDSGAFAREVVLRKENARAYRRHLGDRTPRGVLGDETVRAVLPAFLSDADAAFRVRRALLRIGVESRSYYRPLAPLPGALDLYVRNVCLPVYGEVTSRLVDAICDVVLGDES